MSTVLQDSQLRKLIGSILVDAEESCICAATIVLRMGSQFQFEITREKHNLNDEKPYLKIRPGETVYVTSFEKIDFSEETVQKSYPGKAMYGMLFPTTTMSREGLSLPTTKVDPGYRGRLNWTVRNTSSKDVLLGLKERLYAFKIYLMEESEVPEKYYGDQSGHAYQDSDGIVGSSRKLPVNIDSEMIFETDIDSLDPKQKLKEAGYPFNFIGNELSRVEDSQKKIKKNVKQLEQTIPESVQSKIVKKGLQFFGAIIIVGGFLAGIYERIKFPVPVVIVVSGIVILAGAFAWTNYKGQKGKKESQ